jgi:paraquat-inducible protein A
MSFVTAKSQGYVRCPVCHQLNEGVSARQVMACGRCGSAVVQRTAPRLQAVWALLLAAMVLYVPANTLPVMTVVSLGQDQANTIMEGVIHFLHAGQWLLAAVVLIASIVVPLMKILTLMLLLVSVQWRWCGRLRDKTRLYRLASFVGPWSMVDVFVIALLVTLVQFGEVASVWVGAGTLAFAMVVLLTMAATALFDIRWLWDVCSAEGGEDV